MKQALIILTLIPAFSWAKVSDFNSLINENAKAQRELQQHVEQTTASNQVALQAPSDKRLVLEGESYNVQTNKNALRFKKEIVDHRPSTKKTIDQVADEVRAADKEL